MWGWNESGQLGFPCSHEDKTSTNQTQEFVNILTIPTLQEIRSGRDSQETPQKVGREGTATEGASGTTDDELMVQKVACGSRHTVCLTGTANHIYRITPICSTGCLDQFLKECFNLKYPNDKF